MKLNEILDDETIKVIAVDFDGCLCVDDYPRIGEMNRPFVRLLNIARAHGKKLILNTCRTGILLERAVFSCECEGLTFDAVNENLPERIERYGNDCRKISADLYIDDKALRVRTK